MKAKDHYRLLCESVTDISLFSQAWWLDAVSGRDNWDVVIVVNGEQIIASMPYSITHRLGKAHLEHPPLTQTLGPWLRKTEAKPTRRLAREKELMRHLIDQLPRYDHF